MKAIYLSVFLLSGFGIASANASVTPANWISSTDSTAIGEIGGITINATTGAIGGTPTAQSIATVYTVTASNSAGSVTATVTITILP